MRTKLIILEGQHGAGKTTHADALAKALRAQGVDAQAWSHKPPPFAECGAFAAALEYAGQRARLLAYARRGGGPDVLVVDRWWHSTEVVGWTQPDARASLFRLVAAEKAQPHAVAVVFVLDAPDPVLDARIVTRGAAVTDTDRACRRIYRTPEVLGPWGAVRVDTDRPTAAVTVELARRALGVL